MLVSIIVASYNYARFLRQAIDSGLNQTYKNIEVIVVDDASTDDSRAIISTYGKAVVPVFKENGGHASAINAAFSVAKGDIICLMDADDYFTTDKVERVVEAWKQRPDAHLLYHQLQTIDKEGRTKGSPWPMATWNGSIEDRVLHTGGWWPRPPTSGLCFSRRYLEKMLPMPIGERIWPDPLLSSTAALIAPVIGLPCRLGYYRIHGENAMSKFFPSGKTLEAQQRTARSKLSQMSVEMALVQTCLSETWGVKHHLSLNQHPEYLSARLAAGESVSKWSIGLAIARCPAIPTSMKLKLIVKSTLQ